MKKPLTSYATFNAFFTRKLKPNARKISKPFDDNSLASPCDATILACGLVKDDHINCVKGHTYPVGELVLGHNGKDLKAKDIFGTAESQSEYYVVLYLGPGDYHRYHSPSNMKLAYRLHMPGYLNPVKLSYLQTHVVNLCLMKIHAITNVSSD